MIFLRQTRPNYFTRRLLFGVVEVSEESCHRLLCNAHLVSPSSRAWISLSSSLAEKSKFAQTGDSPAEKKLKAQERSYLEEVLLDKKEDEPKSTAQKVKKGAENTFFYIVGAASLVAIFAVGYMLVDVFWARDSPQRVYSNALKLIRNDERSIAGHGEDTGRGRRRHISNKRYVTREGEERLRVVFHVKGPLKRGRATAEIAKVDGVWDYRFLLVETEELVPETILLIDNR